MDVDGCDLHDLQHPELRIERWLPWVAHRGSIGGSGNFCETFFLFFCVWFKQGAFFSVLERSRSEPLFYSLFF